MPGETTGKTAKSVSVNQRHIPNTCFRLKGVETVQRVVSPELRIETNPPVAYHGFIGSLSCTLGTQKSVAPLGLPTSGNAKVVSSIRFGLLVFQQAPHCTVHACTAERKPVRDKHPASPRPGFLPLPSRCTAGSGFRVTAWERKAAWPMEPLEPGKASVLEDTFFLSRTPL